MREGGFGVYHGIVDASLHDLLCREAQAARATASDTTLIENAADEVRGGMPARAFLTAQGGRVQDAFYHAAWLHTLLADLTGLRFTPTGARGTYTFYVRPGDHLALHRDVHECDLALITGLVNQDAGKTGGGRLRLYPARWREPLSSIRAEPDTAAHDVVLGDAETLLLLGGIIPHCLCPTGPDQERIVSILCFRETQAC